MNYACLVTRSHIDKFFYYNTEAFKGIFRFDDNGEGLYPRDVMVANIREKFDIYFNLTQKYVDVFIYPDGVLYYKNNSLYPTSTLEFVFDNETDIKYTIYPDDYKILDLQDINSTKYNYSTELIIAIQDANYIHCYFEINSFSLIQNLQNLWMWNIDYKIDMTQNSEIIQTYFDISYNDNELQIHFWDSKSIDFTIGIIGSILLIIFTILGIIRFIFQKIKDKYSKWRWMLLLSHLLNFMCGIVFFINLIDIIDVNDSWFLRGLLAFSSLFGWCSLVFTISNQGLMFSAFFTTLNKAFIPMMQLFTAVLIIYQGYVYFGTIMYGIPNGDLMFETPEITAKTLYAVMLGDEVLNTFYAAGVGNIIAEIYLYSFCILMISMVFNIALVTIETFYFQTMPALEETIELAMETKVSIPNDKKSKDKSSDNDYTNWTALKLPPMEQMFILSPRKWSNDIPNISNNKDVKLSTFIKKPPSLPIINDSPSQSEINDDSTNDNNIISNKNKCIDIILNDIKPITIKIQNKFKTDVTYLIRECPFESKIELNKVEQNLTLIYKQFWREITKDLKQFCKPKTEIH